MGGHPEKSAPSRCLRSFGPTSRNISKAKFSARFGPQGILLPFWVATIENRSDVPEPRLRDTHLSDLLCSPHRSSIFYAAESRVIVYDAINETAHTALDLRHPPPDKSGSQSTTFCFPATITSMPTSSSLLTAGTDCGRWALRSLDSANFLEPSAPRPTSSIRRRIRPSESTAAARLESSPNYHQSGSLVVPHEGFTDDSTTTHISIHPHHPTATFGTNRPSKLTSLDLTTLKKSATYDCPFSPQVSVLSPCTRLRLVVGDDTAPLILDANTGRPIVRLPKQAAALTTALWDADNLPPWVFATGNRAGEIILGDARFWGATLAHHRLHRAETRAGATIRTMRAHRGRLVGSAMDGLLWSIDLSTSINAAATGDSISDGITINEHDSIPSIERSQLASSPLLSASSSPSLDVLGMTGEIAGLDIIPTSDSPDSTPMMALALARPRIWRTRAADFWRERREGLPRREQSFWNEGTFWGERRRGLESEEGLGIVRVGFAKGMGWKMAMEEDKQEDEKQEETASRRTKKKKITAEEEKDDWRGDDRDE